MNICNIQVSCIKLVTLLSGAHGAEHNRPLVGCEPHLKGHIFDYTGEYMPDK